MPTISRKTGEEFIDPTIRTTAFDAVPERVYRCDATGGDVDVNMPLAVGLGGLDIIVYAEHDSGNDVNIVPSGADTIAGAAGLTLSARQAVILTSNNEDDWFKVGP